MRPATSGEDDGNPTGGRPPDDDREKLAEYYRQKAFECHRLAEAATDPEVRDDWLRMANAYTQLALTAGRAPR